MENKSWWKESITEELTIFSLLAIATGAMTILGVDSKELVIAVASGLTGYLSKK